MCWGLHLSPHWAAAEATLKQVCQSPVNFKMLRGHNCSVYWLNLRLLATTPGGCSRQCFPRRIAGGGDPQCLLPRNVSPKHWSHTHLNFKPVLQLFCAQRGMPSDMDTFKATSKAEVEKCLCFLYLTAMELPTKEFNGSCAESQENHKNLNLVNGNCKYLHLLYYK